LRRHAVACAHVESTDVSITTVAGRAIAGAAGADTAAATAVAVATTGTTSLPPALALALGFALSQARLFDGVHLSLLNQSACKVRP
jgi:hypothetical protein